MNQEGSCMTDHFKQIFSGNTLPTTRLSTPLIPEGPHSISPELCPIDTLTVKEALVRRLSLRKAPGADHLRTEMLLPILEDVVPIITSIFQICWRWSMIPSVWCLARVVLIYKKGDPLDPANQSYLGATQTF